MRAFPVLVEVLARSVLHAHATGLFVGLEPGVEEDEGPAARLARGDHLPHGIAGEFGALVLRPIRDAHEHDGLLGQLVRGAQLSNALTDRPITRSGSSRYPDGSSNA